MVSLFPIIGGEIFSEIDAIDLIAAVEVYPIGAGGVYDGAGSTVFEIVGTDTEVQKILDLFEQIKNTKPMKVNLKEH